MKKVHDAMLVLPHLKIQNANIVSGPLTWGFPAVTAVLGFVHALDRKLNAIGDSLKLGGVGIICHGFTPQIFRSNKFRDAVFCLTRNPLKEDGETAAFVEEGRANLEISLVIQAYYKEDFFPEEEERKTIAANILNMAHALRLAGGSILPSEDDNKYKPQLIACSSHANEKEKEKECGEILHRLMPGFSLISREDLLADHTIELQKLDPKATALDALLEFSSINFDPPTDEKPEWSIRKKPGWIVPIPVGYSAISELYKPGTVLNARDNNYPFQFVESIYSLGEWRSPHRIKDINHILWQYDVDTEKGLYRCINEPAIPSKI